jgi:hypothetical protein
LGVGYVGTLSHHQQELLNLNYSPYGQMFTKGAQDPSKYAGGVVPDCDTSIADVYKQAGVCFDGSKALASPFMKKYQGYDQIGLRTFGGSANYNSLQVTLSRRLSHNVAFGMAYTYSKAMGTANAYSDFINPICSRCADYRPLAFDRTHLMVINYDWRVPGLNSGNAFLRGITNGWQITGITQFITGAPNDVTVSIPNLVGFNNFSQRVGGSYTEAVRGLFVGDAQSDRSRDKGFDWNNMILPTVAQALAAQERSPQFRQAAWDKRHRLVDLQELPARWRQLSQSSAAPGNVQHLQPSAVQRF